MVLIHLKHQAVAGIVADTIRHFALQWKGYFWNVMDERAAMAFTS